MGKKGQVALEYLILTAFVLIIIIIIFAYSFVVLMENSKIEVALSSVRKLASAADQVSALGPENTVIVRIELPDNASGFQVGESSVSMRLTQLAGITDVVEYSSASITPASLPSTFGSYSIKVEVVDANVVFSVIS